MRLMRRMPLAAAAALAALLLAGPAHAAGWPAPMATSTAFERAWQWWEGLWAGATHAAVAPAAPSSSRTEKSGVGNNPPPVTSETNPLCQVNCDKGAGIDPNG
jgi:hypothetical protein